MTPDVAIEECENCARLDHEPSAVHRVYFTPDEVRLDEIERWCVSCRTQYPHHDA